MDMLVKLYELPDSRPAYQRLQQAGITLRRALAPEKHIVTAWVRKNFSEAWASEVDVAFSRQPMAKCRTGIKTQAKVDMLQQMYVRTSASGKAHQRM